MLGFACLGVRVTFAVQAGHHGAVVGKWFRFLFSRSHAVVCSVFSHRFCRFTDGELGICSKEG